MAITANDIAALAIAAGLAGIWLTGRYQRGLASDQYKRDRLTETYVQLMKGVYLRRLKVDLAFRLGPGEPSPLAVPIDPVSDEEMLFAARMDAYASPKVSAFWPAFERQTDQMEEFLNGLRQQHGGIAPKEIPNVEERPDVTDANNKWQEARVKLTDQVRAELGLGRSRGRWPWRPPVAETLNRNPGADAQRELSA